MCWFAIANGFRCSDDTVIAVVSPLFEEYRIDHAEFGVDAVKVSVISLIATVCLRK